jgi:hypothetical protein
MFKCFGAAAVQVEEVVELLEVVVVLVGSSSGPPSPSPLVPPLQWWLGQEEPDLGPHSPPTLPQHLVATHPLALTLPWWPLVGGQEMASAHHQPHSMGDLVEEALPSLLLGLPGWAHLAKVRLSDGRHP